MLKILVVDDEIFSRYLLEEMIKQSLQESFQIKAATNGLRALAMAKDFQPDIIFMDVMLPNMDGISVYQKIKSCTKEKMPDVVFVTGIGREWMDKVIDASCTVLEKPIQQKYIQKILSKHALFAI